MRGMILTTSEDYHKFNMTYCEKHMTCCQQLSKLFGAKRDAE